MTNGDGETIDLSGMEQFTLQTDIQFEEYQNHGITGTQHCSMYKKSIENYRVFRRMNSENICILIICNPCEDLVKNNVF